MANSDSAVIVEALEKNLAAIQEGEAPDDSFFRIIKPRVPYFKDDERKTLALHVWATLEGLAAEQSSHALLVLLKELLGPIPLSWVLNMKIDMREGLRLEAIDYHDLILSLLLKSDQDSARRLATNHRLLFQELVKLWLLADEIGTGEKAGRTLLHLLKVDQEGCVTKRLFRDRDIYKSIYEICDVNNYPEDLSRKQQSNAQLRLLAWLPELAKMDWDLVNQSFHPDVEESHGVPRDQGLLDFAANHMVPNSGDTGMFSVLIQFYADVVAINLTSGGPRERPAGLEFLQASGAHQRMIKLYTADPSSATDIVDSTSIIYSDLALYVISHATHNPHQLIENVAETKAICSKLKLRLNSPSTRQGSSWSSLNTVLITDIQVLVNLPRSILLGNYYLIQALPVGDASVIVNGPLMTVFYGPTAEQLDADEHARGLQQSWYASESALAGQLAARYLRENPLALLKLGQVAAFSNLTEQSTCALRFIRSFICAPWNSASLLLSGPQPPYRAFLKTLLVLPSPPGRTSVEADGAHKMLAKLNYDTGKDLLDLMNGWSGSVAKADVAALRERVAKGVYGGVNQPAQAIVATASRS